MIQIDEIASRANEAGLDLRGAFNPAPEDGIPPMPDGRPTATLVLLGWIGGKRWPVFAASPEGADEMQDPLDRWSRRVVGGLAEACGATALFPFGGPPRVDFQRCGRRAESLHSSPIGVLIHPDHGPWHSYRGTLAFAEFIDCPRPEAQPSPCDSCSGKPCLSACPVGAFAPGRYDLAACSGYLDSPGGDDCIAFNCAARRACPVGASFRYGAEQTRFHMQHFRESLKIASANCPL